MDGSVHIPMFPLAILPLPGELVPLHIFEPRYKQLLQDAELHDITFGIYFSHEMNQAKIGSLMRLESIIKRYPGGESDVIVKCQDIFSMSKLMQTYKSKMYPGADVQYRNVDVNRIPSLALYELFVEYLKNRNINQHVATFSVYQVACELSLDLGERYKFLQLPDEKVDNFLLNRIRYQLHLLSSEEKSKDVYHLN
ncbi:MAG TPA: LON peptidase substrate-binding domain-containing protein [Ohtaekwangia sp.]|uniref:LON peptidase substrate-binding domain-containing protein n=1 Tax=Ohtaekwangia sp. TaxID=2066019 RepID=UPI002F9354A5